MICFDPKPFRIYKLTVAGPGDDYLQCSESAVAVSFTCVLVFCITCVFPLCVWISCQIVCVCSHVFCPCSSCRPSCTWFSSVHLDLPQPALCFLPFVHWITLYVVKARILLPQPAASCLASRSYGTELNKDILRCQLRVNSKGDGGKLLFKSTLSCRLELLPHPWQC